MAGHSHATNVKWRKDRQSKVRGKLHQKARRDIELLIQEEGKISEKALNIARQHNFPKEKVYQIWEKIKLDQKRNSYSQHALYQAPFGIWLCLENSIPDKLTTELKLKKMPSHLLSSYFQPIYTLKLAGESNLLEEYLLNDLPTEIWDKISYNEQIQELLSSEKEIINTIKKSTLNMSQKQKITIAEEKNSWKPLFFKPLNNPEEKKYFSRLQKELANIKFYINIED